MILGFAKSCCCFLFINPVNLVNCCKQHVGGHSYFANPGVGSNVTVSVAAVVCCFNNLCSGYVHNFM